MTDPAVDNREASAIAGENNGAKSESEDASHAVLQQIEFYFADSNLPFDKFMWSLHTKTDEHWVPIATIASFKRMRQYLAQGVPWIADVLRRSSELEVDEAGTNVRRKREVQPPSGQLERSVYAKGFGEEVDGIQLEVEEFFKAYGNVNAVRMRRTDAKTFKGSVFCEFTDVKSVEAFLKADPAPKWKGEALLIMSKEAYCDMKITEKGLTGKQATDRKAAAASNVAGRRRGFNAFQQSVTPSGEMAADAAVFINLGNHRMQVQPDGTVGNDDLNWDKGCTLRFTGAGTDSINWGQLKKPLADDFKHPPFVKMEKGETEGILGFSQTLSDQDVENVKSKVTTIAGGTVTWHRLNEAEEAAFQLWRANDLATRALTSGDQPRSSGRGGRGGKSARGGRGGARGGRPRKHGREDGENVGDKRKATGVPIIESTAKKARTDSALAS